LFRLTLKGDAMVTLQEELALCRGYLELESLRLGQRLKIDWQLAPDLPMDLPIPSLLLQPLLENAIYHGIEKIEQGGLITIYIATDPHALQIRVENPPGVGPARAGSGIALDNIQRRLQTRYGERGRLAIQATETGFRVTVQLPLAA